MNSVIYDIIVDACFVLLSNKEPTSSWKQKEWELVYTSEKRLLQHPVESGECCLCRQFFSQDVDACHYAVQLVVDNFFLFRSKFQHLAEKEYQPPNIHFLQFLLCSKNKCFEKWHSLSFQQEIATKVPTLLIERMSLLVNKYISNNLSRDVTKIITQYLLYDVCLLYFRLSQENLPRKIWFPEEEDDDDPLSLEPPRCCVSGSNFESDYRSAQVWIQEHSQTPNLFYYERHCRIFSSPKSVRSNRSKKKTHVIYYLRRHTPYRITKMTCCQCDQTWELPICPVCDDKYSVVPISVGKIDIYDQISDSTFLSEIGSLTGVYDRVNPSLHQLGKPGDTICAMCLCTLTEKGLICPYVH